MVPISSLNIHQHELIGLTASVLRSSNSSQVGISGTVVNESMKVITISDKTKDRMVQKKDAYFNIILPDGSTIVVEGLRVLHRPIERVKTRNRGS